MFPKSYARFPVISMQVGKWFYLIPHWYRKIFYQKPTFNFKGKFYENFWHPYNPTWRNERAVEIPIIQEMLTGYAAEDVLEVGNVLSHYFPVAHTILDKYEQKRNVIAQDVVDYYPSNRYRLIISISTIEHVGWDETPREEGKHLKAISHLRSLLTPDGQLVITIPVGYNPRLDADLINGNLNFDELYFYKRISREMWEESNLNDVKNVLYNTPYRAANAFWIGIVGASNQ